MIIEDLQGYIESNWQSIIAGDSPFKRLEVTQQIDFDKKTIYKDVFAYEGKRITIRYFKQELILVSIK